MNRLKHIFYGALSICITLLSLKVLERKIYVTAHEDGDMSDNPIVETQQLPDQNPVVRHQYSETTEYLDGDMVYDPKVETIKRDDDYMSDNQIVETQLPVQTTMGRHQHTETTKRDDVDMVNDPIVETQHLSVHTTVVRHQPLKTHLGNSLCISHTNEMVDTLLEAQTPVHPQESQESLSSPPSTPVLCTSQDVALGSPNAIHKKLDFSQAGNCPLGYITQYQDPHAVFVVHRNTNQNVVVYAANLNANGTLESSSPLNVYWVMFEKAAHPKQELNHMERSLAFGARTTLGADAGTYEVASYALRGRSVTLSLSSEGKPVMMGTIHAIPKCLLTRVFVNVTTVWGLPKVECVEIHGMAPTGEAVSETLDL